MKAIALISGGLDSTLAASLIKHLGVELVALNTVSPFCLCNHRRKSGSCFSESAKVASDLGIRLVTVDTTDETLEIIKKPKHGFGSNMNPCIDCRILLFKKAKELMNKEAASFIVTGEVLGQRPMSQKLKTMCLIDKEAGLEGFVVRPLSAKVLAPTIPEQKGWILRDNLLAINGRRRVVQMELAKAFGIKDYPCASGGCLLTDKEFSKRLKDLMRNEGLSRDDVNLLKIGRHFRLGPKLKLVVGRDEAENKRLEGLRKSKDLFFKTDEKTAGPCAILRGEVRDNSIVELSARITARYCDIENRDKVTIICSGIEERQYNIEPFSENEILPYKINT